MGASQAMGAIGQHPSAQAQANAQNESLRAGYKHQLQQREFAWKNRRQLYNVKIHEYEQGLQMDNERAWNAYEQNQEKLNQQITAYAFEDQNRQVKAGQALGKASMVNSNNGREMQSVIAAMGREKAAATQRIVDANYATRTANEQVYMDQKDRAMKAHSGVANKPVIGLAPPPPKMVAGPSGMGLAAGLLGAAASTVGGIQKAQAPQAFPGRESLTSQAPPTQSFNTNWAPMTTNTFDYNFSDNFSF